MPRYIHAPRPGLIVIAELGRKHRKRPLVPGAEMFGHNSCEPVRNYLMVIPMMTLLDFPNCKLALPYNY